MKLHISRQTIMILILSLVLLIGVLLFSFLALIPQGKEYRLERLDNRANQIILRQYENYSDETFSRLKELQTKNRRVITAYENEFDVERFEKMSEKYFERLHLSKLVNLPDESKFSVYEVNTSSNIDSPASFYDFLDNVNRSENIIGINFPINFVRHGEYIESSFTMKVYCSDEE